MKNIRSRLLLCLLLLPSSLIMFSCNKDTYLDNSGNFSVVVYKTKGDYFNYINTRGKKNAYTTLSLDNPNIAEVIGNDTIYKLRTRLINDYVMADVVYVDDYFTDITILEIIRYNCNQEPGSYFPKDTIFNHVIDKDPFIEFYIDKNNLFYMRDSMRIEQLNEIIKNGELELYLEKLK